MNYIILKKNGVKTVPKINKIIDNIKDDLTLIEKSHELFCSGISSQALVALNSIGVLDLLKKNEGLTLDRIKQELPEANIIAIKSALMALTYSNIILMRESTYILTALGTEVIKSIGEFMLWFGAYTNLHTKSKDIILNKSQNASKNIDGALVAISSAEIGLEKVDPYVFGILDQLNVRGTICDLGCGSGRRLKRLCDKYNLSGIGIDISESAINHARAIFETNKNNLSFLVGDVTCLQQEWADVEILFQTFMTHHIIPEDHCVTVLRNYKSNFPKAKYFIILDTVSPEEPTYKAEPFTSGFLFAHGLQGLEPRKRSELLRIISKAEFSIVEEVKLMVPNSYLWLLKIER